jgi:hypothetical protein
MTLSTTYNDPSIAPSSVLASQWVNRLNRLEDMCS